MGLARAGVSYLLGIMREAVVFASALQVPEFNGLGCLSACAFCLLMCLSVSTLCSRREARVCLQRCDVLRRH